MEEDANNNIDSYFRFNRESFRDRHENLYKRMLGEVKSLLQFSIVLPFQLPLPYEGALSFQDDTFITTFLFRKVTTEQDIEPGIPVPHKVVYYKTRVEMIYVSKEHIEFIEGENILPPYFDLLIEKLNDIITAYIVLEKDFYAYRVSFSMFQHICLYRLVDLPDWSNPVEGAYLLNPYMPVEKEALSENEFGKVGWYTHVVSNRMNPFIMQQEIFYNAQRYLIEGFFREAILYAQMSVETLLSNLFMNFLSNEGLSEVEVELKKENTSFMSMIKNEFHPRLGGKWNIDDVRTRIYTWNKDTYLLRNRIIHAAYEPNYYEAEAAVNAASGFREYVIDLVLSKKKRYPDIAACFAKPTKPKQ